MPPGHENGRYGLGVCTSRYGNNRRGAWSYLRKTGIVDNHGIGAGGLCDKLLMADFPHCEWEPCRGPRLDL